MVPKRARAMFQYLVNPPAITRDDMPHLGVDPLLHTSTLHTVVFQLQSKQIFFSNLAFFVRHGSMDRTCRSGLVANMKESVPRAFAVVSNPAHRKS